MYNLPKMESISLVKIKLEEKESILTEYENK